MYQWFLPSLHLRSLSFTLLARWWTVHSLTLMLNQHQESSSFQNLMETHSVPTPTRRSFAVADPAEILTWIRRVQQGQLYVTCIEHPKLQEHPGVRQERDRWENPPLALARVILSPKGSPWRLMHTATPSPLWVLHHTSWNVRENPWICSGIDERC